MRILIDRLNDMIARVAAATLTTNVHSRRPDRQAGFALQKLRRVTQRSLEIANCMPSKDRLRPVRHAVVAEKLTQLNTGGVIHWS